MPLLQAKIWSVQKNVNLLKKKLAFYRSFWYIKQVAKIYGSLVKRLRRRPLTAKTGVRFPYELLFDNLEVFPGFFFFMHNL